MRSLCNLCHLISLVGLFCGSVVLGMIEQNRDWVALSVGFMLLSAVSFELIKMTDGPRG